MTHPHRKFIPKRHLIKEKKTLCSKKACVPEENKTHVCSFACYQVCPNFCKNPSSVSNPYRPSLLPPPPPPLKHSIVNEKHMFQNGEIITGGMISCALLFLVFIVMKYCNSRGNNQIIRNSPNQFETQTQQDFFDEEHGTVIDHPMWFIVSQGLSQSVIDGIIVFKYKKDDGLTEGTECSVCLGEFEEDDILKLMPKCSHAFHIPCIDTWLRSHKNCPVCRSLIVS